MTQDSVTFRNGRIFDGTRLWDWRAIRFDDGHAAAFGPEPEIDDRGEVVDLDGDILAPGFVDLQVNGGGGIMFNDHPSVETLCRISEAHRQLGVTHLLPTLITDTPENTRAAIDAATGAIKQGVPGVAGLHLEGPHLSIVRKGAHDPALIRPMEQDDLESLLAASRVLPVLKVTIAPENVTVDQVATLAAAGVLVSLGHTDADFATCQRYVRAGARCATHLFNAMSQLGNREPGLVGAVMANGDLSAGLIADTVHVHPQSIRAAWSAKTGPGRIFLVSDSMAVAGTCETGFKLNGREITRQNGILTLSDGTLAGADLDLTTAVRNLVEQVGIDLETAIQAATSVPAALIGKSLADWPTQGRLIDTIRIASDLSGTVALNGSGQTVLETQRVPPTPGT